MSSDDRTPELPVIPEETYTEREEFARGGLGRVLRANDTTMGRVVAIKELLPASALDEARFIREALVTGRLEHPSIVPVYEAGRWPSGEPFYTMKLVSGRPLRDIVKETRSLDQRLALVPAVIDVAEAMAYAHSRRVIHRDIKPSNVIIGQFGETVVIDWGLAKELGSTEEGYVSGTRGPISSDELTSFGDVLGTPAYMAPEQAHGEAVDERTDVYAIGSLLYFVLSGAAPHEPTQAIVRSDVRVDVGPPPPVDRDAATNAADPAPRDDTGTDLIAVARRPPIPLEERRPDVPRELHTIVRKAMAREPRDRYPTAKELADDLKAFQTGRLVSAHHYTPWALLRRWLWRNRVPVGVGLIAVALLVVGAMVSVRRIIAARDVAVTARSAERDARRQAERRSHDLVLLQARASLPHDPTAALAWLRAYPASAPGWDAARAIVAEALASGVSSDVWRQGDEPINAVRFTPDGRGLLVVLGDGELRVLDLGSRRWRDLGPSSGPLDISPDGTLVATADDDSHVILYPFLGGPGRVLGAHDDGVAAVAFSPDGRLLASTSTDRMVRLWPVAGGEPRVLRGHELAVAGVAWSADGQRLATGSEDATLRLWDVSAGTTLRVLRADRSVLDIAFAPDGTRLAAATRSGVRIWDLVGGGVEGRLLAERPRGEVYGVAWQWPGVLVTVGVDGLGVWDRSLSSARWLIGHEGAVNVVALAPDSSSVVSGGSDGSIRMWRLPRQAGDSLRDGNQPAGTGARPRVSPDGKVVAAPGQDGTILLSRGRDATLLRGHEGPVREIVFAGGGAQLISYGLDRTVRLWDVAAGTGALLTALPVQAFRLRVAPDGRHVAWTQGFEELQIFDLEKRVVGCVFRGHSDTASEFTLDGKGIAFADNNDVLLGDLATCATRKLLTHKGSIFSIAFRRDGGMMATASADRSVGLTPFPEGEARFLRGHAKGVYAVAFAPDGAGLASVDFDGVARVWAADGRPRLTLRGHERALLFLAYTPDGRLLATSGADDTVRVWDAGSGDLVQLEPDTGGGGLAIAPDGGWVVSAGVRGVRRWPLDRRDALPSDADALHGAIEAATTARIDENGVLRSN